jgi:hypothetical protein
VNVFSIGAVFLQLVKLLRLEENPMLNKPVDPTLYIDRFADRLNFGSQSDLNRVANTARRLIASMKRDWIQTGRRPSGICGAALYIACHVHGFRRSKRDVVAVVHIGEHTLARRLDEFASTTAGELTFQSFENHARAIEAETQLLLQDAQPEEAPSSLAIEAAKTGCEHLGGNEPHFAHGMCRQCFADFVRISGGMYNGANPPAFARNRRAEGKVGEKPLALPGPEDEEEAAERANIRDEIEKALEDEQFAPFVGLLQGAEALNEEADMREAEERRKKPLPAKKRARGGFAAVLAKAKAAMVEMENIDDEDARIGSAMAALDDDTYILEQAAAAGNEEERDDDEGGGAGPSTTRAARAQATTSSLNAETGAIVAVGGNHQRHQGDDDDDDGNLSDISDEGILEYLAAEEEIKCKEEIWNIMNKEWVEKQAAKRAAEEATQKTLEEQQAAMEAAAAAGVAYKRSRGRPLGSKSKPKPELKLPASITAEDAAMKMLEHKKLSTKINYNVLKNLFATDGLTADKDQNVDANTGGGGKGRKRERRGKKIVGKKRRRGTGKDSSSSSSTSSSSDSDSDSSSNSSSSSSSSSSDSSDSDTESDDQVAGKDKAAIGSMNNNNKKKVSITLPKSATAGKQPSTNTMGNNNKPLPPAFAKKKKQASASIAAERVAAVVKKSKEKADKSVGDGEAAPNRRATRSSGTTVTGGTGGASEAAAAATRRSRPGALGSLKDDFRSKLVGSGGSKGLGLTQKGILGTSKLPPSFKKPKRGE